MSDGVDFGWFFLLIFFYYCYLVGGLLVISDRSHLPLTSLTTKKTKHVSNACFFMSKVNQSNDTQVMNNYAHRYWRTHAKHNHIQNYYYWLRFYLSKQNDARHIYLFSMTAWVERMSSIQILRCPFAICYFFFSYSVETAALLFFDSCISYTQLYNERGAYSVLWSTAQRQRRVHSAHTVCLTLIPTLCIASLYSVISHDIMYNLSKYWYLLHYNDIIEWNFGGNAFAWGRRSGIFCTRESTRNLAEKSEQAKRRTLTKGPNQMAYSVRGGCCCHCRCCIQNQMKQHHETSAIYDAPFIGESKKKYIGNIFGWSISLFFFLLNRSRCHFRPLLMCTSEQWAGSRVYRQHPRMGAVRDGVRLFLYFNRNIKMMESICTWIEREAFIHSMKWGKSGSVGSSKSDVVSMRVLDIIWAFVFAAIDICIVCTRIDDGQHRIERSAMFRREFGGVGEDVVIVGGSGDGGGGPAENNGDAIRNGNKFCVHIYMYVYIYINTYWRRLLDQIHNHQINRNLKPNIDIDREAFTLYIKYSTETERNRASSRQRRINKRDRETNESEQ